MLIVTWFSATEFDSKGYFKGLKIFQEYFYYKEQAAGFLKAQIIMARCTLKREKIMELYDYGMIDFIVFNRPEEPIILEKRFSLL